MVIDPQLLGLLAMMREAGFPEIGSIPAEEMQALAASRKMPVTTEVKVVRDFDIPGDSHAIGARLYVPCDAPLGLIVNYHGGGWVLGNLDSTDATLRILANETSCAIVSVDYRLAPQHPFPAAVDDSVHALNWVAEHAAELTGRQGLPLIVMGDSAGGNLAAVVAQQARDHGGPAIALQVLVYPATESDLDAPGMNNTVPIVTRDHMIWFLDLYVAPADRADPRFAPGKAASLRDLPPAVIVTAQYDVLTGEAKLYGEKLRAAGVEVTNLDYDGAIHGFFTMASMLPIGRRAIDDVSRSISQVVARTPVDA
jgi:acetyl esterase